MTLAHGISAVLVGTWRLGGVRCEVRKAKRGAHRPECLLVHCVACLVEGHPIPDDVRAAVELHCVAVKPAWGCLSHQQRGAITSSSEVLEGWWSVDRLSVLGESAAYL